MEKYYGRDLRTLRDDRDASAADRKLWGEDAARYNQGQLFEYQMALDFCLRHDGRPGKTDCFEGKRRIEVKFLTEWRDPTRDSRHALRIHSAHLPAFDRALPVAEQVHRYCQGFDQLIVGHGHYETGEYDVYVMTRREAEEFILNRLQAKADTGELRLKWKPNEGKAGQKVLDTIHKWGWDF